MRVRACGCCAYLYLTQRVGAHNPLRQLSRGCQAAGREQLSPETGATQRSSFQNPCIGFGNALTLLSDHSRIFFFFNISLSSSGTLFWCTSASASIKSRGKCSHLWMCGVMDGKTRVPSRPGSLFKRFLLLITLWNTVRAHVQPLDTYQNAKFSISYCVARSHARNRAAVGARSLKRLH